VGIVVLHKPIYQLIYLKNKLLDKAWEITAVALAAQVATMPFTLFYFHQFTTYFWLSNLFMTPISFIVVMGGMLLLLVSWIPYVNVLFGYLVWGMIYVMNTLVSWVDALPFSIIKGLYVSPFEFALLLVAFVLLLLLVTVRKKRMLFEMLSVLLLFMVSVTVRLYSVDSQNEMVFFSLRKHTAVDFVKGGQHVLLADTALMADASTVDYSLSGFWTRHDLTSHPKVVGLEEDFDGDFVRKLSNLVSFEGKLIALWDSSCAVEDVFSYRLPVDYLLITGISKGDIKNTDLQLVTNCYNPKMLLVGSTVPRYLAAKWVSQAADLNLPCYDLGDGAFQVDLSSENTNILKY
jgi:competence protein ComEC